MSEASDSFCEVCGDAGGAVSLVICENSDLGCLGGIHLYCCVPLRSEAPTEAWYCAECCRTRKETAQAGQRAHKRLRKGTRAEAAPNQRLDEQQQQQQQAAPEQQPMRVAAAEQRSSATPAAGKEASAVAAPSKNDADAAAQRAAPAAPTPAVPAAEAGNNSTAGATGSGAAAGHAAAAAAAAADPAAALAPAAAPAPAPATAAAAVSRPAPRKPSRLALAIASMGTAGRGAGTGARRAPGAPQQQQQQHGGARGAAPAGVASKDTLGELFAMMDREEGARREMQDRALQVDGSSRSMRAAQIQKEAERRAMQRRLTLKACQGTRLYWRGCLQLPLVQQKGSWAASMLCYGLPDNTQCAQAARWLVPLADAAAAGRQPEPRLLSMDELGIRQDRAYTVASLLLAPGQADPVSQAGQRHHWAALWKYLVAGKQAVGIAVPPGSALAEAAAAAAHGSGSSADGSAEGLFLALVPNMSDPASMSLFGLLAVPIKPLDRPLPSRTPARGILRRHAQPAVAPPVEVAQVAGEAAPAAAEATAAAAAAAAAETIPATPGAAAGAAAGPEAAAAGAAEATAAAPAAAATVPAAAAASAAATWADVGELTSAAVATAGSDSGGSHGGGSPEPMARKAAAAAGVGWADNTREEKPASTALLELGMGPHYATPQRRAVQAARPARLHAIRSFDATPVGPLAAPPGPLEGMRIGLAGFLMEHELIVNVIRDLRGLGAVTFAPPHGKIVVVDLLVLAHGAVQFGLEKSASFPQHPGSEHWIFALGLAHLLASSAVRVYADDALSVLREMIRLKRPLEGEEWQRFKPLSVFPGGLVVLLDAPALLNMHPGQLAEVLSQVQRLAQASPQEPGWMWAVAAAPSHLSLLQSAAAAGHANAVANWGLWQGSSVARPLSLQEVSSGCGSAQPAPAVENAVKTAKVNSACCRLVYLCSCDMATLHQAEEKHTILSGGVEDLLEFLKSR